MDHVTLVRETLLGRYGIIATDIRPIVQGNQNLNFKAIGPDASYFIKIVATDRIADVERFTRAERLLGAQGALIITHIETNDGRGFVETPDGLFLAYPFIEGSTVGRSAFTPALTESCGAFLARFHEAGRSLSPEDLKAFSPETENLVIDFERARGKFIGLTSNNDIVRQSLQIKESIIAKLTGTLTFVSSADTLVHGDYQNENFLVTGDSVTHLLDLEKIQFGSRYVDVARFIVLVCLANGLTGENISLAKAFLKGYEQVFAIDVEAFLSHLHYIILKRICSPWVEKQHMKTEKPILLSFIQNDINLLGSFVGKEGEIEGILRKTFL
jgi:Ser/Thr protein kinase RdoA (MazF antagonist)